MAAKPVGNFTENAIADAVAKNVVDEAEAVDVQTKHREGCACAASLGRCGSQSSLEPLPVAETGERIMFGAPRQFGEEMVSLDGESGEAFEDSDPFVSGH